MAWEVEYINITGFKNTGKCDLLYQPLHPAEVAVDPEGGPAQMYGADFIVRGRTLIWKDASLPHSDIFGVLEEYPVKLRVQYERA